MSHSKVSFKIAPLSQKVTLKDFPKFRVNGVVLFCPFGEINVNLRSFHNISFLYKEIPNKSSNIYRERHYFAMVLFFCCCFRSTSPSLISQLSKNKKNEISKETRISNFFFIFYVFIFLIKIRRNIFYNTEKKNLKNSRLIFFF